MTADDRPVRTLLVDNYDSYTYNLFQLLAVANGVAPTVVRNDEADWAEIVGQAGFDNIVISPGPGRPEHPDDFGLSAAAIAWARAEQLPLLGICLGHQGLAVAYGGRTRPAPRVMHGQLSRVRHEGGLLAGIPQDFEAVRYHSLAVPEPLPNGLRATAWAEDGTVMALEATDAPLFGVQFHPESILTGPGRQIIENFRDLTPRRGPAVVAEKELTPMDEEPTRLRLTTRRIPGPVDAELLFAELRSGQNFPAVWLDSAKAGPDSGRFSYLVCGPGGPLHESVTQVDEDTLRIGDATGERLLHADLFEYLRTRLNSLSISGDEDLPFDFTGGYVGCLGYECPADPATSSPYRSPQPPAALLFADRVVVLDHVRNDVHMLALDLPGHPAAATSAWIESTTELIRSLPGRHLPALDEQPRAVAHPTRGRAQYLKDIAVVRGFLEAGETYEACLTTRFEVASTASPFAVYRQLRQLNPAPYAAFLDFGDFCVSSSSPERFLRIDRSGRVSAKPIKGTRRRSSDPDEDRSLAVELEGDPKERAENLMIVDLLRNDLGRVCRPGSVVVPRLMHVETYSTVHQLVSTVEGDLAAGRTAVDCVRAAFPGGSMTGAPKVRTMRILRELEGTARGVYSGAIGYFGVNGTADLSIVIRTLVHADGKVSVGAGGAITVLSDPEQEWSEVRLKAAAVLGAVNAVPGDERPQ
ncbi:aminodeoxychorismate synthase component I [Kineosporia rhizophila]|uniref:aminodeoxychorismate synthase component I n=1 Tax=Kineosporia rhizophila TaxID=84633 RepID=UPI001E634223|nr:aminodeoxychorismate synthase component I [Kineosporia rhizophila]MCE0536132.1 aminodeoxychorismate synthase component I [Kineosporia rhizophila]